MKKVIIVGGGIAGLSAGVYARRSGFDTTILEMHTIPGGNSTSWKRGGYLFEGGMHWLIGSSSSNPLHRLWTEVGALREDTSIYNRDPFLTYLDGDQQVCLYRDPVKLESHLLSISPDDAKIIHSLCKDIRKFGKLSMPVMDIKGVQVKKKSAPPLSMLFSMMSVLPRMNALSKLSCAQYIGQFRNPAIRTLLHNVVGTDEYAANSILFTLGALAVQDGGYPKGGSLQMARNIAARFEELGGTLRYGTRVERVVVQDGKTTGVIVDGEELNADAVIVTADTLSAIDHLFESPLHEPWMEEMRKNTIPMLNTFLCFGVQSDLSGLPENVLFPLSKPIEFAGKKLETLGVNNYANFEGYAPSGCAALTLALIGDTYDYWNRAKQDGSYAEKKKDLAQKVMDCLSESIPQVNGKFAVWDVATPLTYERYCGTYKGSWMTLMPPNKPQAAYPCNSAAIAGLYFAGQRMQSPGGLPVAVSTGRTAVQYLCRDTDTMFENMT